MNNTPIILMTDFGYQDVYVAIMKGVINSISANANIIDLTHSVLAFNINQAAFLLYSAFLYFPEKSIFVVVVDPEVGSNRNAILVFIHNRFILCPDNGIISYIFHLYKDNNTQIIKLNKPEYFTKNISNTFHGRDIFAAVSGYLHKNSANYLNMGEKINSDSIILLPEFIRIKESINNNIIGKIIHIDNFGNLITSVMIENNNIILSRVTVIIKEIIINGLSKCYSEKKQGELLAYIGSSGAIEIAVNLGNASKLLAVEIGTEVVFYYNL